MLLFTEELLEEKLLFSLSFLLRNYSFIFFMVRYIDLKFCTHSNIVETFD